MTSSTLIIALVILYVIHIVLVLLNLPFYKNIIRKIKYVITGNVPSLVIFIFFLVLVIPLLMKGFGKEQYLEDLIKIYVPYSKIVGTVALPIIIFVFGALINSKLDWQNHDISLIKQFQEVFFSENKEKRLLGFQYVKQIKNEEMRYNLRSYIIWDIINHHISKPENSGQKFKFDPYGAREWFDLIENFKHMKKIDKYKANNDLKFIELKASSIFKEYCKEEEINKLIKFIQDESAR